MNRKIKLAILALLGFSTACSSVKSNAKSAEKPPIESGRRQIMVMYGVRPPVGMQERKMEIQHADSVPKCDTISSEAVQKDAVTKPNE